MNALEANDEDVELPYLISYPFEDLPSNVNAIFEPVAVPLCPSDIAGIAVTAEESDTTTAYSLAGSVAGMTVTYVNVDATATQADGIIGNIATKTGVSGINIKADTAAGAVEVKSHTSDTTDVTVVSLQRGIVKYSYDDSTEAFGAQVKFSF